MYAWQREIYPSTVVDYAYWFVKVNKDTKTLSFIKRVLKFRILQSTGLLQLSRMKSRSLETGCIYLQISLFYAFKCNITQNLKSELALVSSNRIQIFCVTQDGIERDDMDTESDTEEEDEGVVENVSTEFVLEWKASGPISSVQKVRLMGETLDILIVAFACA